MITVQIKGIEKLQDAIKRYPVIATQNINSAIRKSLGQVERSATQKAPKDMGQLKGNWRTEMGTLRGSLASGMDYALFVHDGTRPHFPPIEAITPWANRHGIPPFLVARAIARKGTKAVPFLRDALEENIGAIEDNFNQALSETLKQI